MLFISPHDNLGTNVCGDPDSDYILRHCFSAVQAGVGDEKPGRRGNLTWRTFWGAHQRFFRHLCMAAKVPGLVRMSQVGSFPLEAGAI